MFKERSQGSFIVGESDVLRADDAGQISSSGLSLSSGDFKLSVGVEVVKAGQSDQACLAYQISFDGKSWSESIGVATGISTKQPQLRVFLADLTGVCVPFVRFVLSKCNGDTGSYRFFYAIPQDS
jgi:hypothetical protein